MKVKKVLVLRKRTTYQIQVEDYHEERFVKLLEEKSEIVKRVLTAHNEHLATVEAIHAELERQKIEYVSVARSELIDPIEDVDLVIAVGGDGTFIDASHFLEDIPLLGVNSSRSSSYGHFCLAQSENFPSILEQIRQNEIEPTHIMRLSLTLNGHQLHQKALNEVLIAHTNPGATSRYIMSIAGIKEEQRSSGVWIGTPAGSTGSLRSAGGVVQDIFADQYQYLVREACQRPHENWNLLKGLLNKNESITMTSEMRLGAIFIDGPHVEYPFTLGDKLEIKPSRYDLATFIDPDLNKIFSHCESLQEQKK